MSASDLMYHVEELSKKGINEIVQIKNQTGEEANMCKIIIDSNELKKQFLANKTIVINSVRFYVEEIAKPPTRCSRCKKFDRTVVSCKNEPCCGRCGCSDHSEEKCPSIETKNIKSVNCGDNHSSFYKGCLEYKKLLKANINELKINNKPSQPRNDNIPSGFYRNYSAAVNSNDNSDKLFQKLNSIESLLNGKINNLDPDEFNNICELAPKKYQTPLCKYLG